MIIFADPDRRARIHDDGHFVCLGSQRRISLKDRLILQEAMNQSSMEGIVRLIRRVLLYSLIIEACGALILSIRWAFDMPIGRAIYYGVFMRSRCLTTPVSICLAIFGV